MPQTAKDHPGLVAAGIRAPVVIARLHKTWGMLTFLVSLIIAFISPLAFAFLLVTQAKWALALGTLTTAGHAFWRARFDGWDEHAAGKRMSVKGQAALMLLVLCLNTLCWSLILSSLMPPGWVSSFNASAPGWLADPDWVRWAAPFRTAIDTFVATAFVEVLAHLLALLPFVLVPVFITLLVIRIGAARARDKTMFTFYVLCAVASGSFLGYFVFGNALASLFWGINGYILWKGEAWLTLLSILVVGFIPFRIATLLRGGGWLRDFFG